MENPTSSPPARGGGTVHWFPPACGGARGGNSNYNCSSIGYRLFPRHPLSGTQNHSVVPQGGGASEDYGQNSVRLGKVARARVRDALSFGLVMCRQCLEDCSSSLSSLVTLNYRDVGNLSATIPNEGWHALRRACGEDRGEWFIVGECTLIIADHSGMRQGSETGKNIQKCFIFEILRFMNVA